MLGPLCVLHASLVLFFHSKKASGISQEPSSSTSGLSLNHYHPKGLPAYSPYPFLDRLRLFCSQFFIQKINEQG